MKYDLHVGQLVRIGNEVSKDYVNRNKRGRIVRFDGAYPVVEMLDPFTSGETTITWCPAEILGAVSNKTYLQITSVILFFGHTNIT